MPKDPMTRLICSGCGNTLDPSVAHCPACDEPTNSAGLLFELELPAPLHEAGYILTTGLTPGDVFDATRPSFNLHSPEGIDFAQSPRANGKLISADPEKDRYEILLAPPAKPEHAASFPSILFDLALQDLEDRQQQGHAPDAEFVGGIGPRAGDELPTKTDTFLERYKMNILAGSVAVLSLLGLAVWSTSKSGTNTPLEIPSSGTLPGKPAASDPEVVIQIREELERIYDELEYARETRDRELNHKRILEDGLLDMFPEERRATELTLQRMQARLERNRQTYLDAVARLVYAVSQSPEDFDLALQGLLDDTNEPRRQVLFRQIAALSRNAAKKNEDWNAEALTIWNGWINSNP